MAMYIFAVCYTWCCSAVCPRDSVRYFWWTQR